MEVSLLKIWAGEKKREKNLNPKSTKGGRVIEMKSTLTRLKANSNGLCDLILLTPGKEDKAKKHF